MLRGFVPGLCACALMLVLAPVSALAQSSEAQAAAANPASPSYPPPSAAEDNEARELFKIGKEAFDDGRFERALKYFKDAYELSHRPALLSNIGTALDRLRRDQEAVDAYHKYLDQVPEAGNRPLIEDRIRIIEAALARSQPAPQPAAAQLEVHAAEPVPTPRQAALAAPSSDSSTVMRAAGADPRLTDSATPVTSRWWFWTGIGAVAVAAVVVVVAVSAGGSSSNANPRAPTLLDPTTRVREL